MHIFSTFLLVIGIASVLCLLPVSAVGSPITEGVRDNGDEDEILISHYPVGDARRCLQESAKNYFRMERFEVLPGNGWDNLRNEVQGQIVAFNFSQCRTTDDGRFLLPDTVTAVPIKSSDLQYFSELISNTEEWTSVTARSINLDAGLKFPVISISGKYSSAFTDMKSKMISDKTVVIRTQARYVRYSIHLQPDTPLHPTFRNRLLEVAAAHERGDEESARYLSQLLVKDFGTHVITSVKAGAAIVQVDHLKEKWMKENSAKKSEILASASFSLFKLNLTGSVSFQSKTESTFQSDFLNQRTSSVVRTFGGPIYKPIFTINEWAEAADRDLVTLDQTGDPLHYLITAAMLPECSASILSELQRSVQQAVETYYIFNVHQGCLQPDSDYFTPSANFDDGACKPTSSNVTFGGMYQNCSMPEVLHNQNHCNEKTQPNPLTGDFSCPSGYQPVLMLRSYIYMCNTGLIRESCSVYYQFLATLTTYWCTTGYSADTVPSNAGYLFGGLYTSFVPNPVTGGPSCPPNFFALRVGYTRDLHVCVSADLEFGAKDAVPFAGFVSCITGNPLAIPGDGLNSTADEWPQRCPEGYSMHLATVDVECQLNYCVQTKAMRGRFLQPLQRPPFVPLPAGIFWDKKEINHTDNETRASTAESVDDRSWQSLSPGAAAGIAVGVTLGSVLLVIVLCRLYGLYRRSQGRYSNMREPVTAGASPSGYGASHASSNL